MRSLKKLGLLSLSVLIALTLLVTGCGNKPSQPASTEPKAEEAATNGEKVKVGFIYVGPVGDAGWSYSHDQGRKYLEENVDNIETVYVESVPESADAERELTQLAEKGCKVIFATSFGYMDYVEKVAKKYPDVVFMHCSGYKSGANYDNYFGRIYQARYLSGIVAGKQTKTNLIGYVAAHPIPEVVRGINAFTLGVKSVNPNATVKVVWTNTWYDPATEKEAGLTLLDAGADVIAQHQDTPGPQQAAEEKGAYSISYNTDMSKFAPKAVLTGPVWNWGPFYAETVKSVIDGTWKAKNYWGGLNENVVGLAPYNKVVSEEVKALVTQKEEEIKSGKWDVFYGPIKDQKGQVRVAEGQDLQDKDKLSMDWFVEGVDGTIK